jgi:hypothetical protein
LLNERLIISKHEAMGVMASQSVRPAWQFRCRIIEKKSRDAVDEIVMAMLFKNK